MANNKTVLNAVNALFGNEDNKDAPPRLLCMGNLEQVATHVPSSAMSPMLKYLATDARSKKKIKPKGNRSSARTTNYDPKEDGPYLLVYGMRGWYEKQRNERLDGETLYDFVCI